MIFRTEVAIPDKDFKIKLSDSLLLIGSCFAQNIGEHLQKRKLSCDINPFGVLYNPESIRIALSLIAAGTWNPDDRLIGSDGTRWFSWLHAGNFAAESRDACIAGIERRLTHAHDLLKKEGILTLTFGTNRHYILKDTGLTIGNCHKQPANRFDVKDETPEEIIQSYTPLLEQLCEQYPGLRILFTVSPYRYAKYGYHGNQLSKAALLLAVDGLVRKFRGRCFYFPAYEIVLDELRDYRFYTEDMLHPSAQTISYLWEKFAACYFEKQACYFFSAWESVLQALEHRPLNPSSAEYRAFVHKIVLKIEELRKKYPNLDAQNEINELTSRIK